MNTNTNLCRNGQLNSNLRLNQIMFLGSHNTFCSPKYGWWYYQQNLTLEEQFQNGVRFLKTPLHWYAPKKKGNQDIIPYIAIAHEENGKTNCSLTKLQRTFQDPQRALQYFKNLCHLLEENPKEILILKIESYLIHNRHKSIANTMINRDPTFIFQEIDNLFEESGLKKRAYKFNGSEVPKLHELREGRNLIILIDEDFGNNCTDLEKYINLTFQHLVQTRWDDPLDNKTYNLFRDNTSDPKKYQIIELHLNPEISYRFMREYRKTYNSFSCISKRVHGFFDKFNIYPNVIQSDFIEQGDCDYYVQQFNSLSNQKVENQIQSQ